MIDVPDSPLSLAGLYEAYKDFDLVINSRMVGKPAKSLFFALRGQRRDGHAFISDLLRAGVNHFVLSREGYAAHRETIDRALAERTITPSVSPNFHFYDKPEEVLQQLAAHHRSHFNIPVVAVTGSNGKTIVKDWLAELLSSEKSVCSSPRSYNSRLGVPLSVWQLRPEHTIAVFEAGIGEPGDMDVLKEIIRPTHGILTNIGTAHLGKFESVRQLVEEKLRLFTDVQWLVIPEKTGLTDLARERVKSHHVYAWAGEGRQGLSINGEDRLVEFPDLPRVYLDNARAVATFACKLGFPLHAIRSSIDRFVPLSKRLEQRQGRDGGPVINDTYSNDYSALAAAVEFAETLDPYGHVTLILGEVQPIPQLAEKLVALLEGRIHRLILVGPGAKEIEAHFAGSLHYADVGSLIRALPQLSFTRETVLVKGASYQGMDQIADMLSRQLHRTTLEIDLDALRHNFLKYRNQLPEGCEVVVMAKASAYGSGALPVARLLENLGADYLAVAYAEEGRELRQGGITLPIMVLNAEAYSFPTLAEYDLEPVVHRPEQFRWAANLRLPVHIELDTGMGRLGFNADSFQSWHSTETGLSGMSVASIFTHLASSDEPAHDAYTLEQLGQFERLYEEFIDTKDFEVKRHALNTNGISRFPEYAYDMVRLGIGLYGLGDEGLRMHLRPALKFTTTICALSDREPGETVGYGRRGIITTHTRLAVLSVGYADGLPRLAGEGRFAVRIHNQYAPTIGSVCMDMCTVDVTGIPEARVGDEAVIFSADHPVELLATATQTIPYEILTGIGNRVHRIYVGE